MNRLSHVVLVTALLAFSVSLKGENATPRVTPSQAPRAIRALYVTGGGFHEFVKQEAIVPPAVAKHANVEWTIDHTAGTSTTVLIERHKDTAWTKQFDVVLYNMSFSHVVDVDWIERLAAAHRDSGVGAVILHGAVHSYRRSESRAWGELMGAFSMRHDAQRPLTVETVAADHPIMRGDDPSGPGLQHRVEEDLSAHLDQHSRQGPSVRHVAGAQHRDDRGSRVPRPRDPRSPVDRREAAERRLPRERLRSALTRPPRTGLR
jgi:hypothetical protein